MKRRTLFVIIWLLTMTVSCAIRKDLETPFTNPINKPAVNDGTADPIHGTKYCKPLEGGRFDGTSIPLESGLNSDGSGWAQGGGCVLRPIREAWAVLNNLEVMKFEAADSFTYTRTINPREGFTHLYEVTYAHDTHVPTIGVIHWTIDWYHGIGKGTFDNPSQVNIVYQRTSGNSEISYWKGGIVLTKVNNEVTSMAVRNEFKALQSSSENQSSARDALNEMIGDVRNGKPDWARLNTGFKSNPSEPDKPVSGKPVQSIFCLKDENGHYPPKPQIASGIEDGVSWIKVRACLAMSAQAVYAASRDHAIIRWSNSSTAAVETSADGKPADPSMLTVDYEKDHFFDFIEIFGGPTRWRMTWTYKSMGDEGDLISYHIDPATNDFPVWNGQIAISAIDPQMTEVEIDNNLLTNVVSEGVEKNKTLSLDLLNALGKQAAQKPYLK